MLGRTTVLRSLLASLGIGASLFSPSLWATPPQAHGVLEQLEPRTSPQAAQGEEVTLQFAEELLAWSKDHPGLAATLRGELSKALGQDEDSGSAPVDMLRDGLQAWLEAHSEEIATIQGLTDTASEDELFEVLELRGTLLQEVTQTALEAEAELESQTSRISKFFTGIQEILASWLPSLSRTDPANSGEPAPSSSLEFPPAGDEGIPQSLRQPPPGLTLEVETAGPE